MPKFPKRPMMKKMATTVVGRTNLSQKDKDKRKDYERNKKRTEEKEKLPNKFQDHAANKAASEVQRHTQVNSALFLKWNTALGPPYHVLLDTNFIQFAMRRKIDIVAGLLDCLLAKAFPYVCSCVLRELEKLGPKMAIVLKVAKDPRFRRLLCDNTYADDCIVQTVTQHPIYIVGTCDKDLQRRIRKIPGIPIMFVKRARFVVERLPEAGHNDLYFVRNAVQKSDSV
eukprot:TRINITY_DN93653_c0_g1_i1.p1 TRINITY_DN93653_c0_g1~~TRINITY_DN93653_c0_g1_i1.p1  ORF type:complete len:235 (-),score=48.56 TRINITY_DN93653_c0_g1_i1:27-707(-)